MAKTVRLAMYKGPPGDFWHTVGHEGACLWTDSIYSHAELVFSDDPVDGKHLCASASARDGGVRFKRMRHPHKQHPQRLLDAVMKD